MSETPRIIPLRFVASEWQVSRREFLRGMGIAAAAAGLGVACDVDDDDGWGDQVIPGELPVTQQPPVMPPFPPDEPPAEGDLRFLTEQEAATLDALVATMLPSDDESPGAREAGVVTFIDFMLAEYEDGSAKATYADPPHAQPYDGDTPPGPDTDEVIWVPRDQLERYGFQSSRTPREVYREGLAAVDDLARSRFGARMPDLSESQQEEIVAALAEDGDGDDQPPRPEALEHFYAAVRQDLIDGMFGDPAYGGNREFIGWRLIGFPGAQRAYTPNDMHTPAYAQYREVQGLAELHASNPGLANEHVQPPQAGPRDGRVPAPTLEPESRSTAGEGPRTVAAAGAPAVRAGREWLCRF